MISTLAELETEVQLRGKWLSGAVTKSRYAAYRLRFSTFRDTAPFEFHQLSGRVFQSAIKQHLSGRAHCRSLDRLHLAAMDELGVDRLMTNDSRQGEAAHAMGYEVVCPA